MKLYFARLVIKKYIIVNFYLQFSVFNPCLREPILCCTLVLVPEPTHTKDAKLY